MDQRDLISMSQEMLLEHFEPAFVAILSSGDEPTKRSALKLLRAHGWTDSDEIPPGESVETFVRKAKARADADTRTRK